MEALFRKLTANDVEARVQSADENGFVLLIYKNARVDQNILDETFTPFGWQNKYEEFKGNLYCSIGIKTTNGEWIWKSNCGTESYTEKEKGEASDAFKRAGFNWGIGRELYTAPKTKIKGHTIERNGKYAPEYYAFDVVRLEVSDELPRRITALTIIGKSMQGGYHEDCVFEWSDKSTKKADERNETPNQKAEPKATEKQIDLICDLYTDSEMDKIYEWAKVESIKDLTISQASALIAKRKGNKQ